MDPYRVMVATAFGPRILGLRRDGGPEQFAYLGDEAGLDYPGGGRYRFRGGHRLWAAPEKPEITYAPDDRRCGVTSSDNRLSTSGPADNAGLAKQLQVTADGDRLVIDHLLTNAGPVAIAVGAWGITQFPLGGMAILPVAGSPASNPYQANRSVALWPYTNLADPRLSWSEGCLVIGGTPGPRLKIGSGPRPGRLGYLRDGYLFTKAIPAATAGEHTDLGAVGQVFVENAFLELESVGPVEMLEPGCSLSHREVWQVTECASLATAQQLVLDQVR